MKILIAGFGVMGQVTGKALRDNGHELLVFDAFPGAQAAARELGARVADTPAQGAEASDLCILFLPGPAQIQACVAGEGGILESAASGYTIVDMCTSEPGCTVRMAEAAAEKSVAYVDAPVLGRPGSISRWCLPVGGDVAALERVRPVLAVLAHDIRHLGPSGSGHKVKLLNQMMFGAINAMTAEMMAVADKVGVPPALLFETITASQAGTVSNLFKELGARIRDDSYANPTFSVDNLAKDVRLGLEMAKENGASPILGRTVDFLNEAARAQGQGSLDTACMWQAVRRFWTKVE